MDAPAYLHPRTWPATLWGRMRRLQLHRVHRPQLAWSIACWILALAIIVALLWPGALTGITGQPVGTADGLVGFSAPLWFRVLVAVVGAALAGATALLPATWRREVVFAIGIVLPVLLLLADRAWPYVIPAALLAAGAEGLLRAPAPRLAPALAAAGTWLVLLVYQFTASGTVASSWVWIALFGFAAAFAAFGVYYGVARAAESRSRALRFLFRERWHPLVVLGVVLAAAAIVALRLTVLRELFPEPDPELWAPQHKPIVSWLLAALVAGVLAAVAIASTRRPLLRVGQRGVTAGLAGLGNLHLVVAALLILVGLVTAIPGAVAVPQHWNDAVPILKVAGVALLALTVLLPRFRGTAARWLAIVAALFLLPNTIAGALADSGLPDFPPSPVQVTILLVAIALGLAIANLAGAGLRPSLVARFAIVPLVAVHAGWLLPAVWTQFGLVLAVIALVITVLLLQPPAADDTGTHSARILAGAALQLLGLAVALLAAPSLLDDPSLIVLGLVWLSVVVVAALCFETVERSPTPAPAAAPNPPG
jgi:hypothetical protein